MKKLLFLIAFLLLACSKRNEYDYEKAGEEYCICMKKMGAPKKYLIAADSCDKKIARRYRWYRYFIVDMGDSTVLMASSQIDSTQKFINGFSIYANRHCCKEILVCDSSVTGVINRLPKQ